jgi:PAS domain S-box-containing protein
MESPHPEGSPRGFLELRDISLWYDSLRALQSINLEIKEAEVHAIVGEHGAGKTSLCLVLGGYLRPHSGKLILSGKTLDALSPRRALAYGIEMVTQQNPLLDNFTVTENLFLDNRGIAAHPFINHRKHTRMADAYLRRFDFKLDPGVLLKTMKLSDRVLVDILKHLVRTPRLLILDEALQKLTAPNCAKMMQCLTELKQRGMSILFVTHRIDDIYNFADKVSIIKNGEILITDSVKKIDKINLIKLAYTQISTKEGLENANREFYQLLKYNEAVLKHLPVNLIVVDRLHTVKLINEYAKKYFGIEKTTYRNTPVRQLFTFDSQKASDLLRHGLSSGKSQTFYGFSLRRGSAESIVNIKIHPIFDETFLIGSSIIVEDITDRERLREQMVLSEKLASIGLLSAGVAHEINNPLEIIYNYTRYLKFHAKRGRVLATVNNLEEELKSISQIVSSLISFSDSTKEHMEQVDINELIAGIINMVKYNAKYRRIVIGFQKRKEPLWLRINKTEFRQVILNLVKNSFEAMPEGGHLTITTRERKQEVSSCVEIVLQDTGCGIQNVNDIFLPFYSTKKGVNGHLGLGLSVSYGIVKKHHGSISVRNRPGRRGCQFTVQIPRSPPAPESSKS